MSFNMVIRNRASYIFDKFYEYDKNARDKFINDCSSYYTLNRVKYITSKEELFVRYINLKLWLMSKDQLQSITDPIDMDHINYTLDEAEHGEKISELDFMDIIFILDMEKL